MSEEITDDDLELLEQLGVEAEPAETGGHTAKEQRIIAGFEEIERFVAEHGKPPEHGESRDIFERLYAVRLDQLRASVECRDLLREMDSRGLLDGGKDVDAILNGEGPSDEELLASLGVEEAPTSDITQLTHVRSREEINAAEEVAQRSPCADYDRFQPLFEQVQRGLESGERQTLKYQDNAEVREGDLFILDGQKVAVANMGEEFTPPHGRPDRRLRVVYDNGTESDLLLRSLQRALNKDKASRRITDPDLGPLFADKEEPDDLPSGYIYVLRSKSEEPFVAEHRLVIHKIGVTGGDVKSRIANAAKDPTYLLADVEVVDTYKLVNINRKHLESLLHRFFANARLNVQFKDRFGVPVEPREWFLVPLPAIEEAIQKLQEGTIEYYRYDRETARVVSR